VALKAKYDPQTVTEEYGRLLKEYGISTVIGDNYSAEWCAGAWQGQNIVYQKSELGKSQLYLECLPLFTRGLVRIPEHTKLIKELRLLERHTHSSGRDTVDHPKNGSDDHSNAVCGVLRNLSNYLGYLPMEQWLGDENEDARSYRTSQLVNQINGMQSLALGVQGGSGFGRRAIDWTRMPKQRLW
jgi:hypothetical protein